MNTNNRLILMNYCAKCHASYTDFSPFLFPSQWRNSGMAWDGIRLTCTCWKFNFLRQGSILFAFITIYIFNPTHPICSIISHELSQPLSVVFQPILTLLRLRSFCILLFLMLICLKNVNEFSTVYTKFSLKIL